MTRKRKGKKGVKIGKEPVKEEEREREENERGTEMKEWE